MELADSALSVVDIIVKHVCLHFGNSAKDFLDSDDIFSRAEVYLQDGFSVEHAAFSILPVISSEFANSLREKPFLNYENVNIKNAKVGDNTHTLNNCHDGLKDEISVEVAINNEQCFPYKDISAIPKVYACTPPVINIDDSSDSDVCVEYACSVNNNNCGLNKSNSVNNFKASTSVNFDSLSNSSISKTPSLNGNTELDNDSAILDVIDNEAREIHDIIPQFDYSEIMQNLLYDYDNPSRKCKVLEDLIHLALDKGIDLHSKVLDILYMWKTTLLKEESDCIGSFFKKIKLDTDKNSVPQVDIVDLCSNSDIVSEELKNNFDNEPVNALPSDDFLNVDNSKVPDTISINNMVAQSNSVSEVPSSKTSENFEVTNSLDIFTGMAKKLSSIFHESRPDIAAFAEKAAASSRPDIAAFAEEAAASVTRNTKNGLNKNKFVENNNFSLPGPSSKDSLKQSISITKEVSLFSDAFKASAAYQTDYVQSNNQFYSELVNHICNETKDSLATSNPLEIYNNSLEACRENKIKFVLEIAPWLSVDNIRNEIQDCNSEAEVDEKIQTFLEDQFITNLEDVNLPSTSSVNVNINTDNHLDEMEDKISVQVNQLREMFRDADPDYLLQRCVEDGGDPNKFEEFVTAMTDFKNYPKMEDYLKRQKALEMRKKFIEGMSVEEFLQYFDDPDKYFSDTSRKPSDLYKANAKDQLNYDLPHTLSKDINTVLARYHYHYYPALKELRDNPSYGFRKSKRSNSLKHKDLDDIFIKELCYVKMEHSIKQYFLEKEDNKRKRRLEAKHNGLLKECPCCCDDEILEEDMASCLNFPNHLACNSCICRYIEEEIGQGRIKFQCLFSDCQSEFSINILKKVLKSTVFSNLLKKRQVEEIAAAEISDLVSCPFCNFATIMPDSKDKVFRCQNPECLKDSCRFCKELNHIPLTCNEKKEHDTRQYLEDELSEAIVRECHGCKKRFIKEEGCNKMICSCGAMMCYLCKKPIKGYDHFSDNGAIGKCPLWSNSLELHAKEVQARAEEAKKNVDLSIKLKYDPMSDLPQVPNNLKRKAPSTPDHALPPQMFVPVRHIPPIRRNRHNQFQQYGMVHNQQMDIRQQFLQRYPAFNHQQYHDFHAFNHIQQLEPHQYFPPDFNPHAPNVTMMII